MGSWEARASGHQKFRVTGLRVIRPAGWRDRWYLPSINANPAHRLVFHTSQRVHISPSSPVPVVPDRRRRSIPGRSSAGIC